MSEQEGTGVGSLDSWWPRGWVSAKGPLPWLWITNVTAEQSASPADHQPAQPKNPGLVPLSAKQGWHSPRCGIKCELWSPHLSLWGIIAVVIRKLGSVSLRASGREPLLLPFLPPRIHSGGVGGWHPECVVEREMGASALVRAFIAAQLQP